MAHRPGEEQQGMLEDEEEIVMDGAALGSTSTEGGGGSGAYQVNSGDVGFLEAWSAWGCTPDEIEADMRRHWRRRIVYVAVIIFFVFLITGSYILATLVGAGTGIKEEEETMTMDMGMASMTMEAMSAEEEHVGERTLDCGDVDSDGDGVGDGCDMCPHDPNKLFPGQCGCGEPEVDSDGDGMMDCKDACPDDPDKIKPGRWGCGSGDGPEPDHASDTSSSPLLSPFEQRQFATDALRWQWMRVFPDFVASVIAQPPLDPRRSLPEADLRMWKSCWNDPDLMRMTTDPICSAMWMRRLLHLPVQVNSAKSLSSIGSEEFTAGIKLDLPDDSMPMSTLFRPCVSEGIDYKRNFTFANELNAFLVDRILGFNRLPAVVPRTFQADELSGTHVSDYYSHCGDDGALEGAMVGWMPYRTAKITSHHDQRKHPYFLSMSEDDIYDDIVSELFDGLSRTSAPEDKLQAMETMTLNMWLFLTGSDDYRYEHSLVEAWDNDGENQHLAVLGNNAAQLYWNSTSEQADKFKVVCKFPEEIARRVLILSPARTHHVLHEYRDQTVGRTTLGGLVRQALLKFDKEHYLPPRQLDVLDINVHRLAGSISWCIDQYGADNVLIPEHRKVEREFKYFDSSLQMYSHAPGVQHMFQHDDDEF